MSSPSCKSTEPRNSRLSRWRGAFIVRSLPPFEIDHNAIHITTSIAIRVSTKADKNTETLLDRSRYTPYPASAVENDAPSGHRPAPSPAH